MISGATYREGLAFDADGAVYVQALGSAESVPAAASELPGSRVNPPGRVVTDQGALYVRFI